MKQKSFLKTTYLIFFSPPEWKFSLFFFFFLLVGRHWQKSGHVFRWLWLFGCTAWPILWVPHTAQPAETQKAHLKYGTQDYFQCLANISCVKCRAPMEETRAHRQHYTDLARYWFGFERRPVPHLCRIKALWQLCSNLKAFAAPSITHLLQH